MRSWSAMMLRNFYPSIPIDKALQLVEKLLNENEDLGETTTKSVTSIMELLKWMFDPIVNTEEAILFWTVDQ